MHTLRAVLSPAHDLAYAMTTLNAMNFSQHRQYLCAGALMLMDGHLESINTANLVKILPFRTLAFSWYIVVCKF